MELRGLRQPGVYDSDAASLESGLDCGDEMMTVQSERDECDINTIVRRFGLGQELPPERVAPQYGDFTGVSDYHSALNMLKEADAMFMSMPADVRKRFDNDAGEFLAFCYDEKNADEMAKLNLLSPEAMERRRKEAEALAAATAPKTPAAATAPKA